MSEFFEHPITHRALAAVASVVVNTLLSAGFLTLFHSVDTPWLTPTPAHLAQLSRCDKALGTAAHRTCVEQVVASVKAQASSVQVAEQSDHAAVHGR